MDTYDPLVGTAAISLEEEPPTLLVLGGEAPALPDVRVRANPDPCCAGILMLMPVAPAELSQILEEIGDPALPIADFADNHALRCDFKGERLNASSIRAFRNHAAPIWRRLAEIPFRASHEDRAELALLRLAYSRDVAVEASFAADSKLLVDYRLLGRESSLRERLEGLAALDLLRRRFFTRTHACGRCGSARLHAFEACRACGSGDLGEEKLVHHYRCGWQAPESRFVQGRLLVCPKCRRELRHFGVDYGKPGIVIACRQCGTSEDEPAPMFACLDCAATNRTTDNSPADWYHYDLTEEGIRALRDGRLPRLSIAPVLEAHGRAFALREFQLLAAEGMRILARYARPFAVGRVSIANVAELRQKLGATDVDAAFRLAIEVVVGSLRDSDFVAADGTDSMLIGFPETSARDADCILKRLKKEVAGAVTAPLQLMVTAADGDAAADLLNRG